MKPRLKYSVWSVWLDTDVHPYTPWFWELYRHTDLDGYDTIYDNGSERTKGEAQRAARSAKKRQRVIEREANNVS